MSLIAGTTSRKSKISRVFDFFFLFLGVSFFSLGTYCHLFTAPNPTSLLSFEEYGMPSIMKDADVKSLLDYATSVPQSAALSMIQGIERTLEITNIERINKIEGNPIKEADDKHLFLQGLMLLNVDFPHSNMINSYLEVGMDYFDSLPDGSDIKKARDNAEMHAFLSWLIPTIIVVMITNLTITGFLWFGFNPVIVPLVRFLKSEIGGLNTVRKIRDFRIRLGEALQPLQAGKSSQPK